MLGYRPRVDFRDGIVAALDYATGKTQAPRETAAASARALVILEFGEADSRLRRVNDRNASRPAILRRIRPTHSPTAMRIRRLTAFVRLPLKRPFSHASATRQESDNVLVRCELDDGTIGWGEGVPRELRHGRNAGRLPGATGRHAACRAALRRLQCLARCGRLCERFTPAIDRDDPRGCYGNALALRGGAQHSRRVSAGCSVSRCPP